MNSRTTPQFRAQLAALPVDVQRQAKRAYTQFWRDPWYPALQFKRVHSTQPIYSARIGLGSRAVGKRDAQGVLWFWIGGHADYDALLRRRR